MHSGNNTVGIEATGALEASIASATSALLEYQRPDGHWVFELEADCTIPAEYVLLRHYLGEPVDAALEAKIAERWQYFVDDTTPRWAEIEVKNPGLMKDGKPLDVEKIVFGVATFFHVGSPGSHFALREHVLSDVVIRTMQAESKLRLIFDMGAKPVSIDFGDGKIVRGPFQPTLQPHPLVQAGAGPGDG